jgi:hypothetical protein
MTTDRLILSRTSTAGNATSACRLALGRAEGSHAPASGWQGDRWTTLASAAASLSCVLGDHCLPANMASRSGRRCLSQDHCFLQNPTAGRRLLGPSGDHEGYDVRCAVYAGRHPTHDRRLHDAARRSPRASLTGSLAVYKPKRFRSREGRSYAEHSRPHSTRVRRPVARSARRRESGRSRHSRRRSGPARGRRAVGRDARANPGGAAIGPRQCAGMPPRRGGSDGGRVAAEWAARPSGGA